jgi:5-methylcytosine-specific restriction endonuclease McrA
MDWRFVPFPEGFETDPEPLPELKSTSLSDEEFGRSNRRAPSGNSARRREYVRPDPSDVKAYMVWAASTPPTSSARKAEELARWFGANCRLCNQSIDMNLAGHHPGRWNVDHINPRAKGGTETWGNVQLAHRGCNSIKSHGALPEPPPWLYAELCRTAVTRFENGGKPALNRLERLRLVATKKVAELEMVKKMIKQSREEGIAVPPGLALSRRKIIARDAIAKVERHQNRLVAKQDARDARRHLTDPL